MRLSSGKIFCLKKADPRGRLVGKKGHPRRVFAVEDIEAGTELRYFEQVQDRIARADQGKLASRVSESDEHPDDVAQAGGVDVRHGLQIQRYREVLLHEQVVGEGFDIVVAFVQSDLARQANDGNVILFLPVDYHDPSVFVHPSISN
jgi:hypothetical protein